MSSEATVYPALASGQNLTLPERTERLLDIRDELERGYVSAAEIARKYNVSKPTAMEWRKAALLMIAKQNNGFTRDALRHLQTGRIMHKIEQLERDLSGATDSKDKLAIHDRIVKYYDSLHRITGLNSEVIQHDVQLKPMSIHIPREAVEVTVIEQPPPSTSDHPSS